MKLKEGSYENLITNEVKQDIAETSREGLVCKEDDIDEAEAPSMLAEHVSRIV